MVITGEPSTSRLVWGYEERSVPLEPTSIPLVHVIIIKVKDIRRLRSLFKHTPSRPKVPGWTCVGWVKEALDAAIEDVKTLDTCVQAI
jgi:hypothetical protein